MPDQALSKIHHLAGFQFPAVRKTLHHFLKLSQDQDVESAQLMTSIELDPSLLAVFLSIGKTTMADWHLGIARSQYKSTALTLCNQFATRNLNKSADDYYAEQWQRSLLHATLCGKLAEKIGADPTHYRILGLCAGLGHHFLALVYGENYIALVANITNKHELLEAEQNLFGINGAKVASDLLGSWGYSADTLCYQYAMLSELLEAPKVSKLWDSQVSY
ncbi:MAG: HD-like signal output (HDOD) protein [Flavobacterium sp.]|jgi:HD-like signal output (HDOD) protein